MGSTAGGTGRWAPPVAGVAAATLALGAGELTAAALAPASSPLSVVGATLIQLAPPWAVDAAIALFGTADKIIVSVRTDAATAANAAIAAKLTYQDGQTAGEQTANVVATDAGTTNIEFTKATPWPVGKYKVDVTVNGQPAGMTQEIEVK